MFRWAISLAKIRVDRTQSYLHGYDSVKSILLLCLTHLVSFRSSEIAWCSMVPSHFICPDVTHPFRSIYREFIILRTGGRLNIKMSSYQCWDSHVKVKTVSRPYLGKTSLYWDRAQVVWRFRWLPLSGISELMVVNWLSAGKCGWQWF